MKGHSFTNNLIETWPGLPYLGYGLILAWSHLAFGGSVWLSDIDLANSSTPTSGMWVEVTLTSALVILAAPFLGKQISRFLTRRVVIAAGMVASLGALLIILCGPHYFLYTIYAAYVGPVSLVLIGIGTAVVTLKNMELYGRLLPRKAMLYAALSLLGSVFIYFFIADGPSWSIVPGGPTIIATIGFVGLPLLAAGIAILPTQAKRSLSEELNSNIKGLDASFWKLVAVCLVLALVSNCLRAIIISGVPPAVALENNNLRMVLLLCMALVLIFIAIQLVAERANLGKVYSIVAVLLVMAITLTPFLGDQAIKLSSLMMFCSDAFMVLLWLLLAFSSYQRRRQPIILFGLAYGAFSLGGAVGYDIGERLYSLGFVDSNPTILYLLLAGVILILMFVLFSEKDMDRLFAPATDQFPTLKELMGKSFVDDAEPPHKRHFSEAIEEIAKAHRLSKRELLVFRYLAMGRNPKFIAESMHVSLNTARVHVRNIYMKINVHSHQELMNFVDHEVQTFEARSRSSR